MICPVSRVDICTLPTAFTYPDIVDVGAVETVVPQHVLYLSALFHPVQLGVPAGNHAQKLIRVEEVVVLRVAAEASHIFGDSETWHSSIIFKGAIRWFSSSTTVHLVLYYVFSRGVVRSAAASNLQ